MHLISFEGLDGSGKTTQIDRLVQWLVSEGHEVKVLREPGGNLVSEAIRSLLLNPDNEIDSFAELLLFSAARAQLVSKTIRPLLARGVIVICDRFFDSTTAYQGAGRGIADPAWLDAFHLKVTGGLVPRRTYLLDLDPKEAYNRRSGRSAEDRMEQSGKAFYARVSEGYAELALREPDRIRVLDASLRVKAIARHIREDMQVLLDAAGNAEQGQERPVTARKDVHA